MFVWETGGSIVNCFRSITLYRLLVILAGILFGFLPCTAQKRKEFAQEPAALDSHDQASAQKMLNLGAGKVRPMRAAMGTSVHSEPQPLPHWAGSFKVTTGANRTATTQNYNYTMVGTDPSAGGTSATTSIRTILVPLRLQFADGTVFDASSDIAAPLNTSVVNNVLASPMFTPSPIYAGSVNLGTTQYADAVQRGNLWNKVSGRPDYHVQLKPEVYPTQTIVVPAALGAVFTDQPSGLSYGVVYGGLDYGNPNGSNSSPISAFISGFVAQVNDPSALLMFVSHDILDCNGGCLGYHDVLPLGSGAEQTYVYASYNDQALFTASFYVGIPFAGYPDINTLSHEVSEWINNPFVDNIVPGWTDIGTFPTPRCSSVGLLEVGDPLESAFLPKRVLNLAVGGVTWHPQDIAFLPWFEQASRSTSVNGWYTFGNSTSGAPFEPCLGSGDYKYTTLDFPGSTRTRAIGVNNQGTVVGRYRLSGVIHGFIYQNGRYTSLDVPGATGTYPQGINDSGQIVGTFYDANGNSHGFSYSAGGFKAIDFPGGLGTQVWGVNDAGIIVGNYYDPVNFTPFGYNVVHAFQLANGVFTTVDAPLFAYESAIYGLNNSGAMVGGYDTDGDQSQNYAFSGLPKNFTPFTLPGAPGPQAWAPGTDSQTIPFGLNNQNDVVGFYYEFGDSFDFFPQAFVWYGQNKTWQRLNVPGPLYTWYTDFYGINDQGMIVGDYQNRTGIHGVVLSPAGQ